MTKIVLVHGAEGELTLKNGGVSLEGVTSVKRVMEDGVPYVEVEALLARKEYSVPSAMVLVVNPDGEECLKHGSEFIEGLVQVEEKDGVLKLKLEVDSEDYALLRAAKKAAPKEEKKVVKPVAPKPVEKPEA
jgi:hypothetical protein